MADKIEALMKKWGCSREEAVEMLEWDKQTDKMKTVKEAEADLTAEQKKAAKAARITTSEKKHAERKVERKPNEDKRTIIQRLLEAVLGIDSNAKASNLERQIDFTLNGTEYSITLTAHRKPK